MLDIQGVRNLYVKKYMLYETMQFVVHIEAMYVNNTHTYLAGPTGAGRVGDHQRKPPE